MQQGFGGGSDALARCRTNARRQGSPVNSAGIHELKDKPVTQQNPPTESWAGVVGRCPVAFMTMRVTLLMIVVLSTGCAIRQVDTARSMEPGQIDRWTNVMSICVEQ